jgi:hypothetical protein
MSEFNRLFIVIKANCERQKSLAEISCFGKIANESGIPVEKLNFYLDKLQQLGLIRYSIPDQYIYLTAFGKKQKQLSAQ